MPEKAWAYYSSAAEDEITNRENHSAYHRYAIPLTLGRDLELTVCHRIWWRPRILRDVTNVDFATKILGYDTKLPLYIVSCSELYEQTVAECARN